ncbi:MAG: hypothetical protein IT319_06145 [Anaerolineae bacterium]|nr:hypothetical protein [Anaerolineae bacterium]
MMARATKLAAASGKSPERVAQAVDLSGQRRLALVALFVVSAAGLVFEIALTRLFSLFFQYHFTFLAVSLAILGLSLGAASAYYLKPARVHSVGLVTTVLIALSLAFSAAALISAWLPSVDTIFPRALVALVPFFLTGLFAALVYENFSGQGGTFYAADLIGAALGAAAVLGLLYVWSAFSMVLALAALTGAIAVLFVWGSAETGRKRLFAAGSLIVGVGLLVVNLATGAVDFDPLRLTGAPRDKTMITILQDRSQLGRIAYTGWSPFSRVDVVETGDHSARYIVADGGAGSYMMAYNGDQATLDAMPMTRSIEALPFASGSADRTLVVGAGGGKDILLALHADATAITAVEVNPAIVQATRDFADYNGSVLDLPEVTLVEGDARTFAERSADQYDLIYMNLVYTQAVEPASQTLIENYIFTTQAFRAFLEHLAPGGRLAMVAHNGLEGSRAMLTALYAMQAMGIAPAQALDHLWLWRVTGSDQTAAPTVLIVGKDPLPSETVQTLNAAAAAQGMAPLFAPGDYEDLFSPLRQGESLSDYIQADAAYNLSPTDDDQPYFFNLDYALPPAVRSALIVSVLFALGLLAVAWFTEADTEQADKRQRRLLIGYTALIGVGFMLVEVPLIQRFQLLLGQPILSLAAVLVALLVSGGLGSLFSQRWQPASLPARVRIVGVVIAVLAMVYWVALPLLVESLLGASFAVRLLAIVVLTALLGFPMGMPFPSVIRMAGAERQQVALMWAVNGAFSVLGSVLSMVISIQWGFKWALLLGAGMYLLLAVVTSALARGRAARQPARAA